ncbi:GT-D fold domain-containing protein [Paenibacillus tarimensis]|uniref:GT-D fold domain-containing protein n=1 Tax=Paenibacillus tarimensis TaxID=416012 RepID=UPI001F284185|nr:GT-D fold domain-containing glycosyltransferase [Paenibacillus tarimensis]MCF2942983.1 GT-D fold domain-containing glycosyltransferase [Paenibacillus tarimensis]
MTGLAMTVLRPAAAAAGRTRRKRRKSAGKTPSLKRGKHKRSGKKRYGKRNRTGGGAVVRRRARNGKLGTAPELAPLTEPAPETEISGPAERRTPGGGKSPEGEHKSIDNACEAALEMARYEAGEKLLEDLLPPGMLLPALTLKDVVAAGIHQLSPQLLPLMGSHELFERMDTSIRERSPLSVVRLGDGELLALSQGLVYSPEEISRKAPFLSSAGVVVPDFDARDQLAEAVRQADITGVPVSRRLHFQPLLFQVLQRHGIDLLGLRLTTSTINYSLLQEGWLNRLMAGRRVLVIGNAAPGLAGRLVQEGVQIAGMIAPVAGFPDIGRVIHEASGVECDLALVAAGIPAVVIAQRLAAEQGKVALDFGHAADQVAAQAQA